MVHDFFDFYGLTEDFPGKIEAVAKGNANEKTDCVLIAMTNRLRVKFGHDPMHRFIPYIQMYEFEGLLFSDPGKLPIGIGQPMLVNAFGRIRQDCKPYIRHG